MQCQVPGQASAFLTVVGLVNELEQEKAAGKAGQFAIRLVNVDAGKTGLSAVCRKRRRTAISHDHQAAQSHQPAPDHQPGLQQMGKVFTDEKMTARCWIGSPITTDHRDRKRLLSLQTEDKISQLTLANFGR